MCVMRRRRVRQLVRCGSRPECIGGDAPNELRASVELQPVFVCDVEPGTGDDVPCAWAIDFSPVRLPRLIELKFELELQFVEFLGLEEAAARAASSCTYHLQDCRNSPPHRIGHDDGARSE